MPRPPATTPPTPDPDEGLPILPPGQHWAKPGFARRFLKNYDQVMQQKSDQLTALLYVDVALVNLKQSAVDMQKTARGELDRIRRNDIWPNWGTLNHALTAVGTIASCLDGACLLGLAVGAVSLYHTDAGAAAGVATNCLPNPSRPACAEAIVNGAASIGAERRDQRATSERLSDKERATLLLEAGRKAQAGFDEALSKIQGMKDQINDQTLFLKKAYDYARWGDERDNPYDQTYKVETPA